MQRNFTPLAGTVTTWALAIRRLRPRDHTDGSARSAVSAQSSRALFNDGNPLSNDGSAFSNDGSALNNDGSAFY